jgi:hypothetical protein
MGYSRPGENCGARVERNLKGRTVLLLGLASLLFGCEGRLSSEEAGLLDAVAFVTGGQQEGAQPHGSETRWRRTVDEREVRYDSIRENAGFGEANDPHRDSRHVKVSVSISSPQKCVFKTVTMTAYSKGTSQQSFQAPSNETTTFDFSKVQRFDIEDGDQPSVVIEGKGWQCKDSKCQDKTTFAISAPRADDLPRVIESKRRAIDFVKKACPGAAR